MFHLNLIIKTKLIQNSPLSFVTTAVSFGITPNSGGLRCQNSQKKKKVTSMLWMGSDLKEEEDSHNPRD